MSEGDLLFMLSRKFHGDDAKAMDMGGGQTSSGLWWCTRRAPWIDGPPLWHSWQGRIPSRHGSATSPWWRIAT
ncbi:hypothetical protein MUK42_26378 [Musa troglodytarum]|uniref:Uncharacterized protein n=1 Tax=Musa troglodytarum TaxID=320322 RepID=A0A9E7HSP6_9LILI|nr:hypothetical protein MUK42_26378 [Musa troglodytarum]